MNFKLKILKHLMMICLVMHSTYLLSQESKNKVKGIVLDETGALLPGVNVLVLNKNISTVTGLNGEFTIDIENEEDVLVFKSIGYLERQILVGDQTQFSVQMEVDNKELKEVIIVGYGTQSKRNVTGAISKVDMKKNQDLPNTSITQSLRGRVAGVQFTDNGRPGQNGNILIRGPRSLSAGNNPLLVLDGTIYNGVLSDINPNDISSMEILKDASASAIYGSRAANGVILITSKKGVSEKPTINFNTFNGISSPGYKIKLLSPQRYIEKIIDYRKEAGLPVDLNKIDAYLANNEAENYLAGKTLDPYEVGTQDNSGMNAFDLNISGKSANTNYFISAALTKERGIILNDNQERITFRVNLESKIKDWMTIGTNTMFGKRNFSGIQADLDKVYQLSPYGSLYNEDGTPRQFVVEGETVSGNPIYNAYYRSNEQIQNNLFANFFAVLKAPFLKGLSYKLNVSPNVRWIHSYNAVRQDMNLPNNTKTANKSLTNHYDWMIENILSYNKQINKNNHVDLTLLYSRDAQQSESTGANSSLLSTDVLGWNNLALGETQTVTSGGQRVDGVSYMARLNYRFRDKYLATATVRRDGSSVFSENEKYATLPSASLAWVMSEENFIKKIRSIDLLKLRVSYGAVGNQAISPYQSLSRMGSQKIVYGDGGTTSLAYYPSNMANSDLKWETTYTSNIGLDFEILNGRIGGSLEIYQMQTKDLLVTRSLPRMTGFVNVWANLGQVNNEGVELTLNTVNVNKNDFEWSTNFTFSNNKNRIVHLYRSDTDGDGLEDDDIGNSWFIGKPISSYYDYVFDGIYQEGDTDIPAGYKPGYVRVKDINPDGTINAEDRTIIGQGGQPQYRWGIGNNFTYKNLTLSVFVNAMQGWISSFGLIGRGPAERSLNFIDYGWWTPQNKSNTRPSLLHENKYGHSYYISRNFVRIQDISLVYNFPKSITEKLRISNLKASVSGKNLYTFTDWIGADPESGATDRDNLYPMPRTVAFGFNIGF
ncbi:SusC/RagA family TonB-linked outer membrane protein [Desertivirga xinjiangensis]|uniref:SusC/RagA family TonB-linked outer membrane protein n=1 Tax=Desertivirga xinjiangensis TaxID=539206 RepID=UPI002108DF2F|nr:TonB-dependent receptor [Pedobacter xinjiangensis]